MGHEIKMTKRNRSQNKEDEDWVDVPKNGQERAEEDLWPARAAEDAAVLHLRSQGIVFKSDLDLPTIVMYTIHGLFPRKKQCFDLHSVRAPAQNDEASNNNHLKSLKMMLHP